MKRLCCEVTAMVFTAHISRIMKIMLFDRNVVSIPRHRFLIIHLSGFVGCSGLTNHNSRGKSDSESILITLETSMQTNWNRKSLAYSIQWPDCRFALLPILSLLLSFSCWHLWILRKCVLQLFLRKHFKAHLLSVRGEGETVRSRLSANLTWF